MVQTDPAPVTTAVLQLPGLDVLFAVSQWPRVRLEHLSTLIRARAIENQLFVALCNSCAAAGETRYGGHSAIIGPLGETLAEAGGAETVITAEADMTALSDIRARIPVFSDRRPTLYKTDLQ